MTIKIESVNKQNIKTADSFALKEWRIFNKEQGYRYNPKNFRFVAKENKKAVGYMKFEINGGAAYLNELRKNKCHVFYMKTARQNKGAVNFYKKNGYTIIATLPNNMFHFDMHYLVKGATI